MTLIELQHMAATRRLKTGDAVRVRSLGSFVVVDNTDPALITVRSAHGAILKLGRLSVQPEHKPVGQEG